MLFFPPLESRDSFRLPLRRVIMTSSDCCIPFVPFMSATIGAYMYTRCKSRFLVQNINPSEVEKAEVARMPKFGGKEAMMGVLLAVLVVAWIILGEHAGLGGPTLYAVFAMFLYRMITWDDIRDGVSFGVSKHPS
jgi:sodium-dependent dicarboxylate transporter 2/3/5